MARAINSYLKGLTFFVAILLVAGGCLDLKSKKDGDYLQQVLALEESAIKSVMNNPQEFELQMQLLLPNDSILLKGKQAQFSFVDYSKGQYFYPASTVKFPVAILATQWAEQQPQISIVTPYRIGNDTITHYIAQDLIDIFAISDNQAFNRLYDLLGRDFINQRMADLNLGPFRLAHRLSIPQAATPEHPIYFFETSEGIATFQAQPDRPVDSIVVAGTQKGIGFISDEVQVNNPMDFSRKNYFPLETMVNLMERLFPLNCSDCPSTFKWSENTEAFVKSLMSGVPRKQGFDEVQYPDGYVKFFFLGDSNQRIDPSLKIHNKVGYAYGTLTDIAYVVDTKHDLHYILGATLLVNKNGIFNDNTYEYDSIGLPFLAQSARSLHQLLVEAKTGR